MKRKDEWSYEEDLLLAQTILEHIETNSTQLKAFEEVAERLRRTPAACGFRWNSAVRKDYTEQIKEAKSKRKSAKNDATEDVVAKASALVVEANNHEHQRVDSVTPFDPIIDTLTSLKQEYLTMKATIDELSKQVTELTNRLENVSSPSTFSPTEDMHNLMQIIRRAEQLGLFEKYMSKDKEPKEKPAG
ncbi:hypothetical protein [Paenibacillus lactis]|uniref:hypothetical protein n=1 Tax=Paenibacillus lactis TaxID=228574 RepID=UPI003D74F605